jgi:NTP pyrophosphatase (non-canonical NTP hydrolase)
MDRQDIFRLIEQERDRQDLLHPKTKRKKSDNEDIEIIANLIDQLEFLAVLIEEVGEVGKAMQGDGNLKEELIQTASCCVRWVESL